MAGFLKSMVIGGLVLVIIYLAIGVTMNTTGTMPERAHPDARYCWWGEVYRCD